MSFLGTGADVFLGVFPNNPFTAGPIPEPEPEPDEYLKLIMQIQLWNLSGSIFDKTMAVESSTTNFSFIYTFIAVPDPIKIKIVYNGTVVGETTQSYLSAGSHDISIAPVGQIKIISDGYGKWVLVDLTLDSIFLTDVLGSLTTSQKYDILTYQILNLKLQVCPYQSKLC